MKIFLTGGNGFIGKNFIEQVGAKYSIIAPSHKELDLLNKAQVSSFMAKHAVDVVLHTANVGGSKKDAQIENPAEKNILMFNNLVSALTDNQRMIFLGSGAEYDKSGNLVMTTEDDFGKSIPKDEYGFSKYTCSKIIETKPNIVNLRCFGVFGKYEDYTQRFISGAIVEALNGKPITIRQNVWFDYLYVDDLVKIIEHFIFSPGNFKFYNTGRGEKVDLITLASIVNEVCGSNLGINVLNSGLSREYTCNNQRLMDQLGGFKFTTFKQAIINMVDWYKINLPKLTK